MKIPSVRILSQQLELLAEIDLYTSLLFTRNWQGVAEFELHIPSSVSPQILKEGNLIMLDNDGHRTGIIRSVQMDNGDSSVNVTIKGQTLNGLACQRCTIPLQDKHNGGYDNVPALSEGVAQPESVAAETILKTYAKRHLAMPLDPMRRVPNLSIPKDLGRGTKTVWMSRYEQLDSVLQSVAEYTDMGWEIYYDRSQNQLAFDVIPGVDRTIDQAENSRIIFSLEFENINTLTYAHDLLRYKNLGYAGGVGEGADRTVLKVTNEEDEPQGFSRFETFLDCGSLEVSETGTTLSLLEEGKHKLQDYSKEESLTATIAPSSSFVYQQNWDLGDLVTLIDRKIGVSSNQRITAVTERYESGSYGIDVTFGMGPKRLERVIRNLKNTVR